MCVLIITGNLYLLGNYALLPLTHTRAVFGRYVMKYHRPQAVAIFDATVPQNKRSGDPEGVPEMYTNHSETQCPHIRPGVTPVRERLLCLFLSPRHCRLPSRLGPVYELILLEWNRKESRSEESKAFENCFSF